MSTTPVTTPVTLKPVAPKPVAPNWFTHFVYAHIFWIVLAVVLGVMGHVWLKEHDARVIAENTIKVSEAQVKTLQDEIKQLQVIAAQKVVVIQKESAAIKTTPQAIPVIQAFDLALNARPLPQFPLDVQVAAIPLAHDLEQCRIDKINLDACQVVEQKQEGIVAEKDKQIVALKAKPKFWNRVKGQLESGSILITIGILIAKVAL